MISPDHPSAMLESCHEPLLHCAGHHVISHTLHLSQPMLKGYIAVSEPRFKVCKALPSRSRPLGGLTQLVGPSQQEPVLHIKLWSGHVWTYLKLEPSEPSGVEHELILTYGRCISIQPYQGVTQLSHNIKLLIRVATSTRMLTSPVWVPTSSRLASSES